MAELIVEPIQTAELESSGYIGQPEGNIDLTENNVQVNVAEYEFATPKIPIQEDVPAVNPSTQEQTIVPAEGFAGMGRLVVNPVTPSIDPNIQPENIKQGVDILGVQGTLKPHTLITKQITENGTYTAEDDNADGYSEVNVDVKPILDLTHDLHNRSTDVLNTYIDQLTGKLIHYSGWTSTDFIKISPSLLVLNSESIDKLYCAAFDTEKNFIGNLRPVFPPYDYENRYLKFGWINFILEVYPQAVYLRISGTSSAIKNVMVIETEANFRIKVPLIIDNPLALSTQHYWCDICKDSLLNIINALTDRTGQTPYTLTIGTTNLNKLTAEQKAIATNKNWTLA